MLIAVTLFSMLISFLSVRFALSTERVIDSAVSGSREQFLRAALLLICLIAGMVACSLLMRALNDTLSAQLDKDLKQQFTHKLLRSDLKSLSKYHSGDLVHRMNADLSTVSGAILSLFPSLASLCVRVVAVIIVLLDVSPWFTVGMLVLCLVLGIAVVFLQKYLKKMHMEINTASGKISSYLQEIISKLLIVQGLNASAPVEGKADELLESRWQLQKKRRNFGLLTSGSMSLLSYSISFVALIWCASELMHGRMTFGALTSTTQLAGQLQMPIYELPSIFRQLISMDASAERLREIENIPDMDTCEPIDAAETYKKMNRIDVRGLTFSYDRCKVLDNVSCSLKKGSMTVIVGASGIGKSTLLRLLLGVYRPDSGDILINTSGGNIPVSLGTRPLFSYAPQGNLLMSGTIRENITFACENTDDESIERAVHISAMDDFLPQLELGLDTPLGENASGLSEGQAQRLSVARAILSGSPILLLDEITSSLDVETEKKVLTRIKEMKDRTCIVVTHRPAALSLADTVLMAKDDRLEVMTPKDALEYYNSAK